MRDTIRVMGGFVVVFCWMIVFFDLVMVYGFQSPGSVIRMAPYIVSVLVTTAYFVALRMSK